MPDVPKVGWIIGFYDCTWGGSQLITVRLSDQIGRHIPNVSGMRIERSVAQLSGSIVSGADLNDEIAGVGLGVAAYFNGQMHAAFWFMAMAMFGSGAILWRFGEKTQAHPNPLHPD